MATEGPGFEERFHDESVMDLLDILQVIIPFAAVLLPLFWFVDHSLAPERSAESLGLRFGASAILGGIYFLARSRWGSHVPRLLAAATLIVIAGTTSWIGTFGPTVRVIYFIGLVQVICMSVLFPWSAWSAAATSLLVIGLHVGISWFVGRSAHEMVIPVVFLLETALIAVVSVVSQHRRRRRDLAQRIQIRLLGETAKKMQRESLERMSASSKLSSLGEMAGGIAHEINNPLAMIKVLSEHVRDLLSEPVIDVPRAKGVTDRIIGTVDRISRIVKGLLNFARDASADPVKAERLVDVLEAAVSLCREKFAANGVALDTSGAETDAWILCRQTEAAQVLVGLLSNAYDAIHSLEKPWIKVETRVENGHVVISVTDSGSGISSDVRKKMFEPFYTTKPPGVGTGMGLSIALRLARNQNGRLEYDEASPNTRFVVTLPLAGYPEATG